MVHTFWSTHLIIIGSQISKLESNNFNKLTNKYKIKNCVLFFLFLIFILFLFLFLFLFFFLFFYFFFSLKVY